MKTKDLVNLVGLLAFGILTVLSLILHVLTFVGQDPRALSLALWWGLQLGSALSLILAIAVFLRREPNTPLPAGWSLDKVLALCSLIFVVYAAFNFLFTGSVLLHDGHPAIVDGHYAHGAHGSFTPVSKEQFTKYMILEARLNSGHWMAFFLFALTAWRRRARKVKELPAVAGDLQTTNIRR